MLRELTPKCEGGGLRRDIGLVDAVGIGLGSVMGAGIFLVTGVVAGVAGPAFLIGLVVAGAAAVCNGLSSARLAAAMPRSGGTYEYASCLLHPAAGFAAGWMFLVSKLAAAATVACGFGRYVAAAVPGLDPRVPAVSAVVLLTVANLLGVRKAGLLNRVIVGFTLAALSGFVVVGLPAVEVSHLRPFAPHGWRGVAESCAMMFFAYTGYARIATLGEEVREPATTIPRAIVLTLGISLVMYLAVGWVAVGGVGAEVLARAPAPLERAAASFGSPWLPAWLSVGATIAMAGVLLSQILGISRMMLALARRGDLPACLGAIASAHSVPARGIMASGAIVLGLVFAGRLEVFIGSAAFAILVYYALTNICAIRQARSGGGHSCWTARAGLFACIAMAGALPGRVILWGGGLLAVGFLWRFLIHRLAGWRRR